MPRKTTAERFWERVDKNGPDGCWVWTAATQYGYGCFKGGGQYRAHRFSYELLVGPIPEGLVIDHLCRNKRCVNPAHLEPVTQRENVLRGEGVAAIHAAKTHCVNGHEFTESNTRWYRGTRRCRACRVEYKRRKRAERKAGSSA